MILLIILTMVLTIGGYTQTPPGARQISLSHSDVTSGLDPFSIYTNPATLSNLKQSTAAFYYSPSPFGLKELAHGNLAYSHPFHFGSIAIGAMLYGYSLYKETKLSSALSYKYNNSIILGTTLHYHTLSIQKYGTDASLYFDVGLLFKLSPQFAWGIQLQNLNRATFGEIKNQIPVIYSTGFLASIAPEFALYAALEKDILFPLSLRGGIEYDIIEYLTLRAGFNNEPTSYSAGIGINVFSLNIDYSFFSHQDLGLTHAAGLRITFDK